MAHAAAGDARLCAFDHLDQASAVAANGAVRPGAHGRPGLLEGIPYAVKSLFSAPPMPTRPGTRLPVAVEARGSGPASAALQAEGALLIGTTRTTEFALGNYNVSHVMPRNPLPYAEAAATGGSSAGSASAVGGRLVPLALGTDTGGSVRIPAALCGVVGYKSSPSLVSCDGVYPLSPLLDSVGVLAQDIGLAELALRAMTGAAPVIATLSQLRLGVCDTLNADLDRPVDHAWRRVLSCLLRAGVTLTPIDLPGLDRIGEIYAELVPYQLCQFLGKGLLKRYYDQLDPVVQARLRPAMSMTQGRADALLDLRARLAEGARRALNGLHGWIAPATPCLAPSLSSLNSVEAVLRFNARVSVQARPVNVYDQCAVTIPAQWPDMALPVGIQIAAAHGEDSALLGIARAFSHLYAEA
ncbi:amidase [Bordetella sp. N]|uniref:amidase n=1 Tax=Bordetella sp. N TaxID=1746199 RepID=UPI0018D218E6|nr:amidase family protein [Bordetella sp. N]